MARRRGRFLRLLLALVVIIGAAAAAAPLVPLSPLKSAIERRLSDTLGRKVTIDSVRLNIIRGPYLTLSGMIAQETPAFGGGVFLKANDVRADLDAIQYLRTRQIAIETITFRSPQINLVKNKDGVWSWTTLGKQPPEQSTVSLLVPAAIGLPALPVLSLLPANVSTPAFKRIRIENASVKLIDNPGSESPETLYKNIALNASLTPNTGADSVSGSHAEGELIVQSEEDGEADLFKSTLPFDLKIDSHSATGLSVSGSIGPGPIETKNLIVGAFAISGKIHSESGAPLAGDGKMSATEMFIRTINLSEQVARALKLDQIGDMSSGTGLASLETDFQVSKGTISTPGLRVQQLDGLGDATTQNGSFKVESALSVNYAATVILSPDSTSRVKSASQMLGMLVTILETNDRLSVPVTINGDVRRPEIQVDVSRIF